MLVVDKSPEKNKAAAATNPSVVITGSTRGLGFALAKEFLERGCRVTINGRTGESVDGALSRLNSAAVGERSGLGAEADRAMHAHFVWLTGAKVTGRFLIAPFRRRDLFAD